VDVVWGRVGARGGRTDDAAAKKKEFKFSEAHATTHPSTTTTCTHRTSLSDFNMKLCSLLALAAATAAQVRRTHPSRVTNRVGRTLIITPPSFLHSPH